MSGEIFFEGHDVAVGVVPSDLDSGQHPTHGFWVDMDGYDGVAVLFIKNAGITGNDPTFRLQQAKDGSGTDAKHLYFHRVLRKSSASTSIRGRWDIASDRETNLFTYDTWGEENTILGVYVERRWLDEDYNFLRATIFDPGDVPFQSSELSRHLERVDDLCGGGYGECHNNSLVRCGSEYKFSPGCE